LKSNWLNASRTVFSVMLVFYWKLITHNIITYVPNLDILNLSSLENRMFKTSQNFALNLLHSKIDSPRLLERIHLRVPRINARTTDTFHIPISCSNFLINDPLLRSMRSLNNITNVDTWSWIFLHSYVHVILFSFFIIVTILIIFKFVTSYTL